MARDDEAARYRQAAQLTLDQLKWCIDYFRTIRKVQISKSLAKNHAAISRRLEDVADGSGSQPPR
jgi:hypothetical protein